MSAQLSLGNSGHLLHVDVAILQAYSFKRL